MMKKKAVLLLALAMMLLPSCGLKQNSGTGNHTTESPAETDGTSADTLKSDTEGDVEIPTGDVRISFAAAGDNLIHESVYKTAATHAAAMTNYDDEYYFTGMYSDKLKKIIGAADIAFVNQESPIVTGRPVSAYPSFNTPPAAADALVDIGFDVVNLANNHITDMDGLCEGVRGTIQFWKNKPVMPIGVYEGQDDYNTIRIMECKGKRIAFLSYTYGTNGYLNYASSDIVIPYIKDSVIIEQVSRASEVADAVIVSMHWGTENSMSVNAEQKRLAALCSKYGADVIIGHHSHTLQPMEWLTNEAGEKTLVMYSLGNLISSQVETYKLVGGIATFDMVFPEEGGFSVENVLLTPIMTHYSSDPTKIDSLELVTRYGVSVGLLEDYTEEMCRKHGTQVPGLNGPFSLDTLRGYVTDTVSTEFLPDFLK